MTPLAWRSTPCGPLGDSRRGASHPFPVVLRSELVVQAIAAVLIITDPLTRGVFFTGLSEHEPVRRLADVCTITIASSTPG